MNKSSQSILDYILKNIDDVKDRLNSKTVNKNTSEQLYKIWSDSSLKIADNVYKRPVNVAKNVIDELEAAGVINIRHDNNLEITKKGADIINVIVLANDQSIFTKKSTVYDYNTAYKMTQASSKRKGVFSSWEEKWWKQVLK